MEPEPTTNAALFDSLAERDLHVLAGSFGLKGHSQTLAHRGVLLLDELPEFPRSVLEALRQPLEDGVVAVARVGGSALFPARFQLVGTINVCIRRSAIRSDPGGRHRLTPATYGATPREPETAPSSLQELRSRLASRGPGQGSDTPIGSWMAWSSRASPGGPPEGLDGAVYGAFASRTAARRPGVLVRLAVVAYPA